jgi:transposase
LPENFSPVLQENVTESQAVPHTAAGRPVRIFCQDESRVGRLPVQRRRLTVRGVTPVGPVQYPFENCDRDGAVEPTTGASFLRELPHLNTVTLQIFLDAFAPQYQAALTMLLMATGSGHKAQALVRPVHVVCVFLPPYRPALNPLERLWQDLNAPLAWVLVAQLEALERHGETIIRQYSQAAIHSLTSYPYFVHAVNALDS